jgi:hypothetical protein
MADEAKFSPALMTAFHYPASERKAEHGVGRLARCGRRGHTHMVSAVWVVPITLRLLPRNGDVFFILASSSEPLSIFEGGFCWIAIHLVATAHRRLVGHEPRRAELLVDGQVCGLVSGVVLLRARMSGKRARCEDERYRRDQVEQDFGFHDFLLCES